MRIPGKPNSSRNATTSGVITPRSSAMIGSSPSVLRIAVKSSFPGASTHWPRSAVLSPPGISQHAAKVVHARDVDDCERCAHALDPPFKAVGTHAFPVVERITPELSGAAEVIRWHTGDDDGLAVFVEFELLGVGPNVCRVLRDEDRQIADDPHPALVRVSLQSKPLPEEEKLVEHVRFDLFAQLVACMVEC